MKVEGAARERERPPRGEKRWIATRDSKCTEATGEEGGAGGEVTPWSRCDRTGRVSARRAVFIRHQIGSNLSTYQGIQVSSGHIFPRGGKGGRKEIPVERQSSGG